METLSDDIHVPIYVSLCLQAWPLFYSELHQETWDSNIPKKQLGGTRGCGKSSTRGCAASHLRDISRESVNLHSNFGESSQINSKITRFRECTPCSFARHSRDETSLASTMLGAITGRRYTCPGFINFARARVCGRQISIFGIRTERMFLAGHLREIRRLDFLPVKGNRRFVRDHDTTHVLVEPFDARFARDHSLDAQIFGEPGGSACT